MTYQIRIIQEDFLLVFVSFCKGSNYKGIGRVQGNQAGLYSKTFSRGMPERFSCPATLGLGPTGQGKKRLSESRGKSRADHLERSMDLLRRDTASQS